nr:MAG TPA: hypothetical protein [Caudoviricetes sp.]
MILYEETQIRTARVLLESLEVRGYENCKNVVLLRQILDSGEKETKDGKSDRDGD